MAMPYCQFVFCRENELNLCFFSGESTIRCKYTKFYMMNTYFIKINSFFLLNFLYVSCKFYSSKSNKPPITNL